MEEQADGTKAGEATYLPDSYEKLSTSYRQEVVTNGKLAQRISQLETMQHISVATIEELRHHAADIQQVVSWLHAHAPDRFDARLSMGQLITGILDEWLVRRQPGWKRALSALSQLGVNAIRKRKENGATDDR